MENQSHRISYLKRKCNTSSWKLAQLLSMETTWPEFQVCAGFDWGRVHFLHISYLGAMFGFVMKNGVNNPDVTAEQCLHSQCFSCFSYHPNEGGDCGCTTSWEMTQLGQVTQLPKETIRMASCSVLGAEWRRKWGHSEWWHFCFRVTITWGGALLSCRWLNTCLPRRSSE